MQLSLLPVQNALKKYFRKVPSARSPKVTVSRIKFILRNILKNVSVILAKRYGNALGWCSGNRYPNQD